jgi:hypothetical protein
LEYLIEEEVAKQAILILMGNGHHSFIIHY